MKSMYFLAWLPLVFYFFHDMEEVFMAEAWYGRYKDRIDALWPKKKPFGLDYIDKNVTASIAIGVTVQGIPIFLICLLSVIFDNYWIWYGSLVGSVIHMLLLHLGGVIKLKRYFPGIVTSAILFVPSLWLLYEANRILQYSVLTIVIATVGTGVVSGFIGLKFLHKRMIIWSRKLQNYSQPMEPQVETAP